MPQIDQEVREVCCSTTGKPMNKIPLWMADIKVKFVSDEARQKHPSMPDLAELEPLRRASAVTAIADAPLTTTALLDSPDTDSDVDAEETDEAEDSDEAAAE